MTCPDSHPHSRTCYIGHKCRCDRCREANTAYTYAFRRRQRGALPPAVCARCGLPRDAWRATSLCGDCNDVLTREERRAWA